MKIHSVKVQPYKDRDPRKSTYKRMRISFFSEWVVSTSSPRSLRKFLPSVLLRAGVHPDAVDTCVKQTKWSWTAGCSCGCSPGFIVENLAGRQVFVDLVDGQ